jgi:hypothetical protein
VHTVVVTIIQLAYRTGPLYICRAHQKGLFVIIILLIASNAIDNQASSNNILYKKCHSLPSYSFGL